MFLSISCSIYWQSLGYLPLAIIQAGPLIRKFRLGLPRYLEMYMQRRAGILEDYKNSVQRADDYKHMVFTTWTVSYEKLDAQASLFLRICAFLYHDGI
jgi:hypothetical protein